MPIEIKTVYTKKKLLQFNNYIAASKKFMWIFLAVCTVFVTVAYIPLAVSGRADLDLHLYAFLLFFIDALYIFGYLAFPHFTLKKHKALNAQLDYSFAADTFTVCCESEYLSETTTVQYSYLDRIGKKGENLYLFLNRAQGYIVDLSTLSPEETALLKTTLQQHIKPKKFKWKD